VSRQRGVAQFTSLIKIRDEFAMQVCPKPLNEGKLPQRSTSRRRNMHKTDIVVALANNTDLGVNKADLVVSAFIEQITNALSRGESVALLGFGTFNVSARAAREGRNPQTGATIQIAASKTVTFKAGKALKDAVNE
jgi:DNA-binding protein HU-beta